MLAERDAIEQEREVELARRHEELEKEIDAAREGRREGVRPQRAPQGRREGPHRHPRALRARARPAHPGLGRVPRPVRPSDPRGRDALARAEGPLRRVLRGRHGRRRDQAAHRPPRPRRGGDQAPRPHRSARRRQAAVGPAQAEGHQAPEDRRRLQPSRRAAATASTTRGP